MGAVPCTRCGHLVEEIFMEHRVCIGCQKEHRELQAYARQEAIDAYQIGRRVNAVTHGQARRFMGRFSGKLGRYR